MTEIRDASAIKPPKGWDWALVGPKPAGTERGRRMAHMLPLDAGFRDDAQTKCGLAMAEANAGLGVGQAGTFDFFSDSSPIYCLACAKATLAERGGRP